MKDKILIAIGSVLMVLGVYVLTGCQAQEAGYKPKHLDAKAPNTFAAENQDLKSNRIFFWKEGVTKEQVKAVLTNSEKIDSLEGKYIILKDSVEKFENELAILVEKMPGEESQIWIELSMAATGLSEEITRQQKRIEIKQREYGTLLMKYREAELAYQAAKAVLDQTQAALDTELSKPVEQQNPEAIGALKTEIEKLAARAVAFLEAYEQVKSKLADVEKAIAGSQTKIVEGENELKTVTERRSVGFPSLINKEREIAQAAKKLEVFQEEASPKLGQFLGEIVENVDEFTDIPMIRIRFSSGNPNPAVELERSDQSEGPAYKVQAKYHETGGKLEFDVEANGVTYLFNVSRSKYDDPSGRIFYQGDVLKTENGRKRFGVAKFVDRNLN